MLLKTIMLAGATALLMGSCDSTPAKAESKRAKTEQDTPVQETNMNPGDSAPASFVNGITEANSKATKGKINLKGTLDKPIGQDEINLYATEGGTNTLLKTVKIKDNAFDFGTEEYEVGIYMLAIGTSGNNEMTIILNPEEKVIDLGIRQARLSAGMYSKGSLENQGWLEYAKLELSTNNAIRTIRKKMNNSTMRAKYEQQIASKEKALAVKQVELIGKFPGTFLAKLMTWKQHPYKGDKGKFWSDIDWSDESLIRTPIISDRIQTYMRSFSGGSFDGFLNCVDLIMNFAKEGENTNMVAFTGITLLEGFYSSGMEDVCQYIIDSYIYEDSCGADAAAIMDAKAQGVINLQIGKTPPDFTIKSWENQNVNLAKTCRANEYTLVMFWSSWCHKCEEEIPVLKQTYNLYKSQGFEVIGISVDTDRGDWINAIQERDIPWPNVSQLQLWDSPVAKDYRVTTTPTMFLLDKDGKIVAKPDRIRVGNNSVEGFLKKNI